MCLFNYLCIRINVSLLLKCVKKFTNVKVLYITINIYFNVFNKYYFNILFKYITIMQFNISINLLLLLFIHLVKNNKIRFCKSSLPLNQQRYLNKHSYALIL